MKAMITGKTPRQELIMQAKTKMAVIGIGAHNALESVIGKDFEHGTIGAAMREYYVNCSESALERLIREVKND